MVSHHGDEPGLTFTFSLKYLLVFLPPFSVHGHFICARIYRLFYELNEQILKHTSSVIKQEATWRAYQSELRAVYLSGLSYSAPEMLYLAYWTAYAQDWARKSGFQGVLRIWLSAFIRRWRGHHVCSANRQEWTQSFFAPEAPLTMPLAWLNWLWSFCSTSLILCSYSFMWGRMKLL